MTVKHQVYLTWLACTFLCNIAMSQQSDSIQQDTAQKTRQRKNVIRYNLSGALLFGPDRFIVFGYERVIKPRQSISINFGKASLPKFVSVITDSFQLSNDVKNSGVNVSVDYRFYLAKENKYLPPHGLYIGPYYSFNKFTRDNDWNYKNSASGSFITSNSKFTIHTVGFELGYQLIIWKRMTLDFLMVGPGIGFYNYKASFSDNLDPAKKEQLLDGLQELLTQKFPGFNYVIGDKEINGNGNLKATSLGYRYLMQVGYNF